MVSNISFSSILNPERIHRSAFDPEYDIECLKNDAERSKDFPVFPDECIGRSQVRISTNSPHKLELTKEDKDILSKLSSSVYGFHGNSDDFWVHYTKPGKGRFPNVAMGDGRLTDGMTRHDFVNELVNKETQAFQIAGNDMLGGRKLITVVKNNDSNTMTMYTCDSKQCYPMVIDGNIDIQKVACAITDQLTTIQGATIWQE